MTFVALLQSPLFIHIHSGSRDDFACSEHEVHLQFSFRIYDGSVLGAAIMPLY